MPDDVIPATDFAAQFADARRQVQVQHPQWAGRADDATPRPFRALGHDRGRFFFWSAAGRQVIALRARDLHSAGELVQLAPLQWWEGEYPGRQAFDTKSAGDAMIQSCYAAGIYNPDKLRGRGVWLDRNRVVIHLGDRLIVDGAEVALTDLETAWVYEQAQNFPIGIAEAMSDTEARGLLRVCCEVAWTDPDRDGRLLAGWLITALLCGGMAWRPHLWITSEGGGGKSWVLDNLVKPVLRSFAVMVQGKTTEAGIRGEMSSDARPVVYDEAETQNEADRARLQGVLDLARQSSTEDGGTITKGTKDGGSRRYLIRSSFLFASVNLGLTQAADESRFAVLSIGAGTPEQFATLKRAHSEVFTVDFAARLLARSIRLLPTIRANAETLADAIARTGAGRRAGDTLGTLMAGAISLTTTGLISPGEADALIAKHAWVRQAAADAKPEPEWRRALDRLAQHRCRFVSPAGRPKEMTVSELVLGIDATDGEMGPRDCATILARHGLRLDGEALVIATRHQALDEIFAGTPWSAAWLSTIARAPGATRTGKAWRFVGSVSKAISVPVAQLLGEEPSVEAPRGNR
jgi:putative DNA primase/helicase